MSKKKKKQKETTIENYYDLKSDAVDELVEALKTGEGDEKLSTNISEITGEEPAKTKGGKDFDPYKIDKLSKLPVWLKALFIKWWFAGLVCYFVNMGLGTYFQSDSQQTDLFFLSGLVLGLVTELFVNPIFRMLESDDKEYNNYMMFPFPFKAYWTFFTNLIYYLAVLIVVNFMYLGLNQFIVLCGGSATSIHVGVEPLLYATFAVIADMAFIGIKDLIVHIIKRKNKMKLKANG